MTILGLPRPFWVVWTGTLVNRLGYFVIPFLTLYLVGHEGLDPATASVVVSVFGAGSLASQPIGGWLADRVGRRSTLVTGMIASAGAYMALGAAQSVPVLAGCAFTAGLATDLYRPAVGALVADIVAPGDRPRAYGLLYWAVNLGVGIAALAGGMLAERSFGVLFVLDAVTCLAFALIVVCTVPETRPSAPMGAKGSPMVLRDPLLIALSVSSFAAAVVYLQGIITLPLAMRADGLDMRTYGLAMAVNPAVILVAQPILIRLLSNRPLLHVYAASGVLVGAGFGLTLFVDSLPGYATTVAVWTLGEIALNMAAPAILAAIAPAAMLGRYQGVWGTSWGLAMFAAPLAGTWVWQQHGAGVLWLGCLLVASSATLILLTVQRSWQRRTITVAGYGQSRNRHQASKMPGQL